MASKDIPQPPKNKARDPLTPAVGPGTNEEGLAESQAFAKHREQQRRSGASRFPLPVSPATPKK